MAVPSPALLALVEGTQQKLSQLDSTAKGLIEELSKSGPQATTRLRELLASGERLVAAVQRSGGEIAKLLPEGATASFPAPSRAVVDALWAQQLPAQEEPVVLPTPVTQPAASLSDLAPTLQQHLPGCSLQLLAGRQATQQAAEATAVLLQAGRAFAAVVHLQQPGSLLPLRVGVLSAGEMSAALAGGAGSAISCSSTSSSSSSSGSGSLWATSQHAVFQQMSLQAAAALQHFAQLQHEGRAEASSLELLLLWLATCSDVFSRPSRSSGSLLLADPAAPGGGLLPPLHRPWQLSWQQLWQAALNPQLRQADHL